MKRLFFIILFLSIAFYPFAANPAEQEKGEQEEDAIEVTVDGVGSLKEDVADARRSAIDDALRIAVE